MEPNLRKSQLTNLRGRAFANEMPSALPEYRLQLTEEELPKQSLQPGIYWRKCRSEILILNYF